MTPFFTVLMLALHESYAARLYGIEKKMLQFRGVIDFFNAH